MNFYELLQLEGITIRKNKGQHIFMQGDLDKSLYFVQSGLLKAYYTSKNGKESIKSFLLPNDTIGSLASVYSKDNCSFSLLCLEAVVLRKIPFNIVYEYGRKNLKIANEIIEFLLHLEMKKEKREYEFLCLTAEERYTMLLKTTPTLVEKVTQNDLARYLGVTPVGLSRIKKRTHNK